MPLHPQIPSHDFDAPSARRADVLICGGGITGLSLAAWLDRAGVHAHVLDKSPAPGGIIGSLRKDGFQFERGPNSVLDKHESLDDLLAWAGIESEAIRVPMASQKRHVWLSGALHEVPTSALAFLSTPLLPFSAKLALLREPFIPSNPADESVDAFVGRRLGKAWVNNLITPMVSGIWAGDPQQLSIEHAFPVMKQMERDGGSIVRGAFRLMRRKSAERKAAGKPRRTRNLLSFRNGLETLPRAIAAKLGERYHSGTTIHSVNPAEGGGWRVVAERDGIQEEWSAPEIAIAAEAPEAARWIGGADAELAALLDSFPYNRLVVASLGIEKRSARIPEGFGFLSPRGEGLRILGAICLSNVFADRAPAGCAALSVFIGGELDRAAFDLDDDEILGLLRRDLRTALDWNGAYRSLHIQRWPLAIPQYDLRHGERVRQIEAAEARWPGLHLAGNWRGGVSVPDRVEMALKLSRKLSNAPLQAAPMQQPDREGGLARALSPPLNPPLEALR